MSYDPLAGRLITRRPPGTDDDGSSRRLVASLVRRSTLRHACGGSRCRHRNHDRDRQHEDLLREAMDVGPELALAEDYEAGVTWHAVSRQDWMIREAS